MLKLIHSLDMDLKNVLEYYNYFVENNYKDINSYIIRKIGNSEKEYFKQIETNEEELYYLVDSSDENYIIGYGRIKDYKWISDIGNISYGVRPNERNKGYGTKILELLLLKCEENGMSEVCVSCKKENTASQKVILNNNGNFEKEFYDDFEGVGLKYSIKLKPKIPNKVRRFVKMYNCK